MNVTNHTAINVAALLHDNLGAARTYRLELEQLELDDALLASPVEGTLVLTRLDEEILVDARIETSVKIECQRCLEPFTQPVRARMSESFLMSTDVRTGARKWT